MVKFDNKVLKKLKKKSQNYNYKKACTISQECTEIVLVKHSCQLFWFYCLKGASVCLRILVEKLGQQGGDEEELNKN